MNIPNDAVFCKLCKYCSKAKFDDAYCRQNPEIVITPYSPYESFTKCNIKNEYNDCKFYCEKEVIPQKNILHKFITFLFSGKI